MIARLQHGVLAFLRDPGGAAVDMRDTAPAAPVAAMALMLATLVLVVIDYTYGPWAWPWSVEPGGKRAVGPLITAAIETTRIFAVSIVLWIGAREAHREKVTGTQAMWLTLPYAIALIAFECLQFASVALAALGGPVTYGAFVMIGWGGTILVLVLCVRGLVPRLDWLGALPLAIAAYMAGSYLAPLVILIGGGYLLWEKSR